MSVENLSITASNNTGEVVMTMQAAQLSDLKVTGSLLDPDNSFQLETEVRKTYNYLTAIYQQAVEREVQRIQLEYARNVQRSSGV